MLNETQRQQLSDMIQDKLETTWQGRVVDIELFMPVHTGQLMTEAEEAGFFIDKEDVRQVAESLIEKHNIQLEMLSLLDMVEPLVGDQDDDD